MLYTTAASHVLHVIYDSYIPCMRVCLQMQKDFQQPATHEFMILVATAMGRLDQIHTPDSLFLDLGPTRGEGCSEEVTRGANE
jgi:hypothetical protein